MTMSRVRTVFNGWTGAPGLMTHYFARIGSWDAAAAQLAIDRVRDALEAAVGIYPSGVTWSVESLVDEFEQSTGELLGTHSGLARAGVGVGSPEISPPANQVCVSWKSDGIANGHRVRGRTFLGPVAANAVEANGTPKADCVARAVAFGVAMRNAGLSDVRHVIWHRPTPGGSNGSHHDVVDSTVRDIFAVLRSRRD